MKTGELEALSLRWLTARNRAEQARAEEDQLWEQLCAARQADFDSKSNKERRQQQQHVETVLFVSPSGCQTRDVVLAVGSADKAPGKLPKFVRVGDVAFQLYHQSGHTVYVHPDMLNCQDLIKGAVLGYYAA